MKEIDPLSPEYLFADKYLSMGWSLVMMPRGSKGPNEKGWNDPENVVNDHAKIWQKLQVGLTNMGVVHSLSDTVALDIDDIDNARLILGEFGIDLDRMLQRGMRIVSPKAGRAKVLFKAYGKVLQKHAIKWPLQHPVPGEAHRRLNIFELRAGDHQDVLPPSIHPEFPDGPTYVWAPDQAPFEMELRLGGLPGIPEELLAFWEAYPSLKEQVDALCPWAPKSEVRQPEFKVRTYAVPSDHQDVIGKFNARFGVEEMLERGGYKKRGRRWLAPESKTGIPGVVLVKDPMGRERAYSHHGSDILADGYAHDPFDLFLILQHGGNLQPALDEAAHAVGILDRHAHPEIDDDVRETIRNLMENSRRQREAAAAQEQGEIEPGAPIESAEVPWGGSAPKNAPGDEWPAQLLNPPGVALTCMRWMLETAPRPQPVLALAATLSLLSMALGNKVESETGLRTNNYFVAVARTGEGKDHGRRCVDMACSAAGLSDYLGGEDISSGSALSARMAAVPNTLFQIDEFGNFIAALTNQRADQHKKEVGNVMLKMFSSAGGVYRGPEYADRRARPRQDVEYPCCNLHGTTTPETLWPALSGQDLASGQLGRWLIMVPPENSVPRQRGIQRTEPPQELVEWLQAARAMGSWPEWMPQPQLMPMAGLTDANPIKIGNDPAANALWEQFEEECDQLRSAAQDKVVQDLWSRAGAHAAKIAVIITCARLSAHELREAAVSGLQVDIGSMSWAIGFVKHVITRTLREVSLRVADSEFEGWVKSALVAIEKHGTHGANEKDIARWSRPFRALQPRMRDAVMESIRRDGTAVKMRFSVGQGKQRVAWVHRNLLGAHTAAHPDSTPTDLEQS